MSWFWILDDLFGKVGGNSFQWSVCEFFLNYYPIWVLNIFHNSKKKWLYVKWLYKIIINLSIWMSCAVGSWIIYAVNHKKLQILRKDIKECAKTLPKCKNQPRPLARADVWHCALAKCGVVFV